MKITQILFTIYTQALAIAALRAVQAGNDYISEGSGIQPVLAGVLAALAIIIPLVLAKPWLAE